MVWCGWGVAYVGNLVLTVVVRGGVTFQRSPSRPPCSGFLSPCGLTNVRPFAMKLIPQLSKGRGRALIPPELGAANTSDPNK